MDKEIVLSKVSKATAILAAALIALIFGPVLVYFGGWVFGSLANLFFGSWLAPTLSTMFNTTIAAASIPQYSGILAMIGYLFASGNNHNIDLDLDLFNKSEDK